jgi:phenylacetate-CoA ligase
VALDPDLWSRLPVLTREEVQGTGEGLASTAPPPAHGERRWVSTSGSTGRPVRVLKDGVSQLFWNAFLLREHLWHRRDLGGKLCAIRTEGIEAAPHGVALADWGPPAATVFRTGPAALLGIQAPIPEQAAWLAREDPAYLITHPSNLRELLRHTAGEGITLPGLREVRTFGETVADDLRAAAREAWGVPLSDAYSAQEVGCIALQCPDHPHYHVQGEGVLVEVLDDAGRACEPGEVGRVVLTPLHGFAMPLLRYANGDYAEVGGPCPCGRGLPVLRRVCGRVRNMLTLPDGRRLWPSFPAELFTGVAPVRQFQLEQVDRERIRVRLVADRPLAEGELHELERRLVARFGHPFHLELAQVEHIPRTPGHKYEDFISRVADAGPGETAT